MIVLWVNILGDWMGSEGVRGLVEIIFKELFGFMGEGRYGVSLLLMCSFCIYKK